MRWVILFQEFCNNSFYLTHECVQLWQKKVRCYQNWNGIRWNRETVAMEKWSNTAPCSCHALMSRTFFERKKRRKSSGVEKGKLMEMNGRLQSEEEKCVCVCLKAQESERERERDMKIIICTVCLVWLRTSGQMFSISRIWPFLWSTFCRSISPSFATPPLHSTLPPFNISSPVSVQSCDFHMICDKCYFSSLFRVKFWRVFH